MPPRLRALAFAVLATVTLAACESAEERAERHYQQALASMEAGEVELALVDLRRVFDYDGFHREARTLYAATVRDLGRLEEAYGQYLRLVEQYPDDLPGRVALAEMAFATGNWEEMERHGGAAMALAPDTPEVAPLAAALAYREAVLAEDPAATAAAADQARAVLAGDAENEIARRILITHLLSSDDPAAALPEIDRALAAAPEDLELHFAKLRLVGQMEDEAATDAQLKRMFALFPDNAQVQESLLRWHIARGDTEAAEAFLREVAALTPEDPAGFLTVVRYLQTTKGDQAAQAELDTLIAASEGTPAADLYRSMVAGMAFDAGNREEGIATLRAVVAGAAPSDQTRNLKIMLTRMLIATGDEAGARTLVDEILAEDSAHVEALKIQAAWKIEDDRAGEAISDLRRALDQAPRDPEILTLMATAHEREGSLELAGERLALAVEASGAAVPESIRYARFLLAQGRVEPARQVLEDALRAAPQDLSVIGLLAEIAIRQEDWAQASALRARLEGRTDPEARAIAETLTTALLLSQDRVAETVEMLETQIAEGAGSDTRRALAMLVLVRARNGDIDGARTALAEAFAASPGDMQLRMLEVVLDLGTGEIAAAEDRLRGIVADAPGEQGPVSQLYGLLIQQGREAEAEALIEEQLALAPDSRYLRLVWGGTLAGRGEIDASIAVFEELYAENTSDVIVANNLASLLGTHRGDDPEELERAATIARRLRGREVPAFQDTYGWIEFQRGNLEEALANLEPAAAGLPNDALVQYHLGRAYEDSDRAEAARAQYARALDLAAGTEIEGLPQFAIARDRLAALEAGGAGAAATE